MTKYAAHHGTYQRRSRMVRAAANANPNTICWSCGRTLRKHAPHQTGRPATWHAGHTIDSSIDAPAWLNVTVRPPPGPWLAAEASTCNIHRGVVFGNTARSTGYDWP